MIKRGERTNTVLGQNDHTVDSTIWGDAKLDAIAYSWFADAHPHEAYKTDPELFWQYFQSRIPGVTREQMEATLQETQDLPA